MGARSMALRGALFEAGGCVAVCDSVMVSIDRESRRSMELSDASRALFAPYRLQGSPA